ncbi:MAG: type II secretion system GspH family protein [Candidatus Peribacteria bacterium]|nr:type II secretion system GspH family protein [Candidatus Peribacteria bacterium]
MKEERTCSSPLQGEVRRGLKSAFTLVEMIVVITILAIL